MKIEISEETFEFIKNLSHEMKTQDNRCTASPYFYTIHDEEVQRVPEGCGDEVRYLWDDYMMTREDLLKQINEDPDLTGAKSKEEFDAMNDDDKIATTIDRQDGIVTPYDVINKEIIPHNHNVFLTKKACHKHIETNMHHFKKPYSYADYAWRNPEMEQLYKAIHEIAEADKNET